MSEDNKEFLFVLDNYFLCGQEKRQKIANAIGIPMKYLFPEGCISKAAMLKEKILKKQKCKSCEGTSHISTVVERTFISSDIVAPCPCKNKKE